MNEVRLPPGGMSLRHGFPQWYPSSDAKIGDEENNSKHLAQSSSEDSKPGILNIVKILRYLKASFDEEATLDVLPLKSAGNPGAWHAWQAYRRWSLNTANSDTVAQSGWNWDDVWLNRMQKGIEASISDSVLYRKSPESAGDLIQFYP